MHEHLYKSMRSDSSNRHAYARQVKNYSTKRYTCWFCVILRDFARFCARFAEFCARFPPKLWMQKVLNRYFWWSSSWFYLTLCNWSIIKTSHASTRTAHSNSIASQAHLQTNKPNKKQASRHCVGGKVSPKSAVKGRSIGSADQTWPNHAKMNNLQKSWPSWKRRSFDCAFFFAYHLPILRIKTAKTHMFVYQRKV